MGGRYLGNLREAEPWGVLKKHTPLEPPSLKNPKPQTSNPKP